MPARLLPLVVLVVWPARAGAQCVDKGVTSTGAVIDCETLSDIGCLQFGPECMKSCGFCVDRKAEPLTSSTLKPAPPPVTSPTPPSSEDTFPAPTSSPPPPLAPPPLVSPSFFRRAQGYNSRNGSGGWGGRGDPEQEGIGLVDTCLPTSSMRARNLVNDMQVRHKLWSCAVPQILPASS
eukprot:scaffold20416_cov30-Tisochrysis_lutea.AAC.1